MNWKPVFIDPKRPLTAYTAITHARIVLGMEEDELYVIVRDARSRINDQIKTLRSTSAKDRQQAAQLQAEIERLDNELDMWSNCQLALDDLQE